MRVPKTTSITIHRDIWTAAKLHAIDEHIPLSAYVERLITTDLDNVAIQRQRRTLQNKDEFSLRDQANAITAFAFRNGFLEELHAGRHSTLLDDPTLSRITDAEMKKLMVEASAAIERLLHLHEHDPERYRHFLQQYHRTYCQRWTRSGTTVDPSNGKIT